MVAFQCHEQWTRTLYNALTLNRYIIAYGWINVCMGIGLRIVDDEQERLWSDNTAKRVQKTVNEGATDGRRQLSVLGSLNGHGMSLLQLLLLVLYNSLGHLNR